MVTASAREDTAFAARLYRSFALTAKQRLRNRVGQLAPLLQLEGSSHRRDDFCISASG